MSRSKRNRSRKSYKDFFDMRNIDQQQLFDYARAINWDEDEMIMDISRLLRGEFPVSFFSTPVLDFLFFACEVESLEIRWADSTQKTEFYFPSRS